MKVWEPEWTNPQSLDLATVVGKCLQNAFWDSVICYEFNLSCFSRRVHQKFLPFLDTKKFVIFHLWVSPLWLSTFQIISMHGNTDVTLGEQWNFLITDMLRKCAWHTTSVMWMAHGLKQEIWHFLNQSWCSIGHNFMHISCYAAHDMSCTFSTLLTMSNFPNMSYTFPL